MSSTRNLIDIANTSMANNLLRRGSTLEEEMGKKLLAIDVFAMSIKFLVEDMVCVVQKRLAGVIKVTDIHFVLTVPAIWSDQAKQFMKEAAKKAGVPTDKLTIALEPEVASLYCRHLHVDVTGSGGNITLSKFPKGSKYIVLDAGGGTVDITVHEIQSQNTLREVIAANGGDWGGTMVDRQFEHFLIDVFGENVFEKFKTLEKEDWLLMVREFEWHKREAGNGSHRKITMRFPTSLNENYIKYSGNQRPASDVIKASKYAQTVEINKDKFILSHSLFESFFRESTQPIANHVKMLMKNEKMVDVKAILMVGWYAECPLLQNSIRSAIPELKIIIPQEPSSAVLKGALIFGHNPAAITERVLQYTYGTTTTMPFQQGIHVESKRIKTTNGDLCGSLFHKLIEIGTTVKLGETRIKRRYSTIHKYQRELYLDIYVSREKNPLYVDDKGCMKIGHIEILFKEQDELSVVSFSLLFGGQKLA